MTQCWQRSHSAQTDLTPCARIWPSVMGSISQPSLSYTRHFYIHLGDDSGFVCERA
jgi:hypothetical protein